MRPVKITMTAFGPYKNRETIDFTRLEEHRLFVISGNTGAGKTTIFDAICFALYGEASGVERKDSQLLRSHFAEDDVHTSVELIFQLHDRTYRIFRQMPHVKTGNKTATGGKYELYEISGEEEIPCVDRFHVSDINEKIEQIIGLTKDQFSQIVMLPQGEFRKLLTSETENKEEILRRIFKTSLYKRFAELLKERKQEAQKQYDSDVQERDLYIHQIQNTLPERENSPIFHALRQEHYNTHQVVEALVTEAAHYRNEAEQNRGKLASVQKAHEEKLAVFHRAEAVNQRFKTMEEKRARKAKMDAELPQMKENEQKLAQAEKAAHLEVYEQHLQETKRDEAEKQRAQEAAVKIEKAARETLSHAKEAFHKEEENREKRERLTHEINRFNELLPTVKQLDHKKQGLDQLSSELNQLQKQITGIENKLKEDKQREASLRKEITGLEHNLKDYPKHVERLSELREQCGALKDFLVLQNSSVAVNRSIAQKKQDYQAVKQSYDGAQTRWLEGQATLLAGHLKDGMPCPVCGGTEHPNKARAHEELPSKEELDRLAKTMAEKQEAFLKAKSDADSLENQLAEKEKTIRGYGFDGDDLQDQYDRLVEQGKKLRYLTDELKGSQETLSVRKSEQETLEKAIEVNNEKLRSTEKIFQGKQSTYRTDKALYDQSLSQIPKDLQSLKQLEQHIEKMNRLKKQLEQQWKASEQQFQKARDEAATAKANQANAEKQKSEAAERALKVGQQFEEALKKAGFENESAYKDAKMDETERSAFKQTIEAFHIERSNLSSQIEALEGELADQNPADLEALKTEMDRLTEALETARTALQDSERYQNEAAKLIQRIQAAAEKIQESEQVLQRVTDLYDVVRGDNARKISFERYLQIEFLEQIVQAANLRLKRLSNGQFYLMRSDRLEKRGRQSGLGLDVYDAYTGQTRDVKSLSGGEKFNASLCLALGMADVIQAFEGGVSIETMFIDEGFGSLDEESLNKAIDTLIDLQKSGRMVGVISHVQELKNAIPAVLSVEKTKEGHSRTRFLLHQMSS